VVLPTISDSAVIGDYDTIRRTLERAVRALVVLLGQLHRPARRRGARTACDAGAAGGAARWLERTGGRAPVRHQPAPVVSAAATTACCG
jgi:hypothetical protein